MSVRNSMNTGAFFPARKLIVLVTFICTLAAGWENVQAALLDGLMGWAENPLSERLGKKGERLTVGNFYTPERPDSHGPLGVMGDHTHNEGEFMMSFRFMYMDMDGNRNGTDSLSTSQVLNGHFIAPTDMQMRMYMFSAMYGFNETVTLMAMIPYIENNMNHVTRNPAIAPFETESGAFGDIKLSTFWRLWAVEAPSLGTHRVHLNIGVSLPTGDIKPIDGTPLAPAGGLLPYPMRLGSGTVDFLPGITYTGQSTNYSWGLQALGTHRIGTNKRGYSMGNNYNVTSWVARRWSNWFSTSVRFNYRWWDDFSGADRFLATTNPMGVPLVPTADPLRRGGQRLDVMGGVNFLFPEYKGIENRLAVEGGVPIYQDLAGPQLETDWLVWAGFQFVK